MGQEEDGACHHRNVDTGYVTCQVILLVSEHAPTERSAA
jgi:hypothetical protein